MKTLRSHLKRVFSRQPGFWFYQISGFLIFFLIDAFELLPTFIKDKIVLIEYLTSFSLHFSITLLLRLMYRYIYTKKRSFLLYASISVIGSILSAFLWIVIFDIFKSWLNIPGGGALINSLTKESSFMFFYRYLSYYTILLFGWSALYFGIKFWMELNEERKRYEKVYLSAQEAKLQMLRYQINPHFLFNSLNSLQALMNHNTTVADKMLTQLSDFLRYSLIADDSIYVPLKREIEIIEKYISIEKIRFTKKLDYKIEVSSNVLDTEILCFLLQPIVENAIKHGFKVSPKKLLVVISAYKERSCLYVIVKNSGKWINDLGKSGKGISNVKERLENAYPGKHDFIIDDNDGWVTVTLKIDITNEHL